MISEVITAAADLKEIKLNNSGSGEIKFMQDIEIDSIAFLSVLFKSIMHFSILPCRQNDV